MQYDLFGHPIEEPSKPKTDLIRLDYDQNRVRIVMKDGEPWWIASDLAKVLGYRDAKNATRYLDKDECCTLPKSTAQGNLAEFKAERLKTLDAGANSNRLHGYVRGSRSHAQEFRP